MKSFTPTFKADRDSNLPKLAARDWEQRETFAAAAEAAEERRQAMAQALEHGPRFTLHRLPLNFWVAEITEPEDHLPFYGFVEAVPGCTDLYRVGDHILFFRSNLPEQEIRENIDLSFLPF